MLSTFGGDTVHVVWVAGDGIAGLGAASDVYYRKSENRGRIWEPLENLTAGTSGIAGQPSIAVAPSQKVHVQWHDNMSGVRQIYYQRTLVP